MREVAGDPMGSGQAATASAYRSGSTKPVSTRDVPARSVPPVRLGEPKRARVQSKRSRVTTVPSGASVGRR